MDPARLGRREGQARPHPSSRWSPSSTSFGFTELVTSIDGLSAVGAAAIFGETGDLNWFTSARAVVKHAGLAPRERMSGTFTGRARLTGAGRPRLRVAAWRAVWGCLQTNRVYAARNRHLTTRETNTLTPAQAQSAVAAAILRQLHAVVVHQQVWDPHVAGPRLAQVAGGCGLTPFTALRL